jgi:carbamoyl-phosphate synthase large subunit
MNAGPPLSVAVTGMNALPENPGPGLAVARCLREAYGNRIRIIGLSYDALDPGLYLHEYCDSAHLLSYPRNGTDAIMARLREIQAHERIDVLIPCLDSELPLMVKLAPQLQDLGIRTFLPDAEQLARRAKDRLGELAQAAGVQSPETRRLTRPEFFQQCEEEGWSYPMVVKGVFYDAKVVRDAEEATHTFRAIAAQWGLPVMAQKFMPGEEYNLTAVGDGRGRMLGEVMMKKRAITTKGKAWAGITIRDDALAECARNLVAALQWKGPLEVEAIRDAHGDYQLLEINPRFPAWIYLSHGVGRNLPALLLEMVLGHEPPEMPQADPGVMFIRYAQEIVVPLNAFESLMIDGGRSQPILRIVS